MFDATPVVDEAALVICLEPTDNTLQLGCLGNISARVVFEGRAAHSARPWLGVNAIGSRSQACSGVLELEPNDVEIDGLVFREVVSVTQIDDCGNASERHPGPGRGDAQLPLRPEPHPRRGRGPAAPSSSAAQLEIVQARPRGARRASLPARGAPPCGRRLRGRAEAGLDERRRLRRPRARRASTSGPGATRYAHTADERVEVAELERTYDALRRFLAALMRALAAPRRAGALPVHPARRVACRGARPRHRGDRLRRRRSARADARVHPRGARRRRPRASPPTRGRSGCPSYRQAVAAWLGRRFGVAADPDTEIVPTLGSKEAIFSFAQLALGEKRLVAVPEPAYPVYERGALFAGGAGRHRAAPRAERLAARPRRVPALGRDRALLDLLPEQPDRGDRAACVLRGAGGARPASTGSCSARTRPTRSSGSTSRPSRRSRPPTASTSSSSTRSRSARR